MASWSSSAMLKLLLPKNVQLIRGDQSCKGFSRFVDQRHSFFACCTVAPSSLIALVVVCLNRNHGVHFLTELLVDEVFIPGSQRADRRSDQISIAWRPLLIEDKPFVFKINSR